MRPIKRLSGEQMGPTTERLETNLAKNVLRELIQMRTGANKGDYLPLSVCKARDFITDLIELERTDTKVIKGLGLR